MTCSRDLPCGKVLRVDLETTTHRVLSCLNGHHFIDGEAPRTATRQNGRPLMLPNGPKGRTQEDDEDE